MTPPPANSAVLVARLQAFLNAKYALPNVLNWVRRIIADIVLNRFICSAELPYLDEHRDQIALLGAEAIPKAFEIEHLLETVKRLLAPTTD